MYKNDNVIARKGFGLLILDHVYDDICFGRVLIDGVWDRDVSAPDPETLAAEFMRGVI